MWTPSSCFGFQDSAASATGAAVGVVEDASANSRLSPPPPPPLPLTLPPLTTSQSGKNVDEPDGILSSQPSHAFANLDSPPGGLGVSQERLVFHIPLNDTGSAGLGVSVKGKTEPSEESGGVHDLGIFIKTVLQGGAAFKVIVAPW